MAYTKQTWDSNSIFNPTRMNHIEDGIESADISNQGFTLPGTAGTLALQSEVPQTKNFFYGQQEADYSVDIAEDGVYLLITCTATGGGAYFDGATVYIGGLQDRTNHVFWYAPITDVGYNSIISATYNSSTQKYVFALTHSSTNRFIIIRLY